jgi:hypothetical protein
MIQKILVLIFAGILLSGCISSQSPEKGTLQLTSSPSGAEIYLDNQFRGSTPSTITGVEPGSHTLEFRAKGYNSWKNTITVPQGISNYSGILTVKTDQGEGVTGPVTTTEPVSVTVQVSREQIIIGDSITFSGTAAGMDSVTLTLFGPGKYAKGIVLQKVKPDAADDWSYTWTPGTAITHGIYTIIASDTGQTVSGRKQFTAIGDGVVGISPSSYAIAQGETLTLSGRCTTGAPSVQLTIFGPERYASGVSLGTVAVMADQTFSFRYTTDLTMPTGIYTVYARDVPQTATGSTQFTIGFAS